MAGLQFGLPQSGKSIFLGERIFPLCLRLFLFLARAQKGVWGMNARGLLGAGARVSNPLMNTFMIHKSIAILVFDNNIML